MTLADTFHQVLKIADPAGCNHRYLDSVGDRPRQGNVKTLLGAVSIQRAWPVSSDNRVKASTSQV